MFLVGGSAFLSAEPDAVERFYRVLIPRLLGEVDRGCDGSRLAGFRTAPAGGKLWQFLGVEVADTGAVPAGLAGLRLAGDFGELIDGDGRERFGLNWRWRNEAGPRPVGEFDAAFPSDESRHFWMTANSYVAAAGSPVAEDAVELVEYDASWPGRFEEMARALRALAPDVAERVVHYGSTSIPGMPAKPVIDMLVEVPSFDRARRALIPALNDPAWEYWWYADHMIFIKRDRPGGVRTHHVHIAPPGHRLWEGLAFRDYLRAHPDCAREYVALKRELAGRYRTDREKYTNEKTAFIRKITDLALSSGR